MSEFNISVKDSAISVVMATYNGAKYLAEQVDSILVQLTDNDEIIVSDDCSTDNTVDILHGYKDERVMVVRTTGNLGPIRNFEYALSHARNNIIVLSDQDDQWLPDRLEKVRRHFSQSTFPYDLLVMNSVITDGDLNPTHNSLFEYLNVGPGLLKNIYRNTYVGCHMAFRRTLLTVAMPFPLTIPMHDMWLGLISEQVGQVTFDPKPTLLFRRSTHNHTRAHYPLWQQVTWRLGLIMSLLRLRLSDRFRKRLHRNPKEQSL